MLNDIFDGANNQPLTDRPGWTLRGSGVCNAMCDGAGNMKGSGAGNSAVVVHDTGAQTHYVQAVIGEGFSDITANRVFNIVLRCTNRGDYIGIRHDSTDNRWELWWDGSNRMGATAGDCVAGGVVYAEATHDGTINVRFNGSLVCTAAAGTSKTSTYAGTLAGSVARADVFRSIEIGTIMGPPTGGIDPTYGGTGQSVIVTGTLANASNVSVMLLPHESDPQGAVVQGPKAGVITGGTWSCEFTVPGGRYTSSATLSNSNYSATVAGPEVSILTINGQPIADGEEPPPDTENPVMTGSLSSSNLTSTSYDITGYGATDNVGVAGYERSLDGGSIWLSVGTATSFSVTGRTPSATDQVRVRAFDFAGNRAATPLALAVTLLSAADTTAPVMQGTISLASLTHNSYTTGVDAATDNVAVTGYRVSQDGGTNWIDKAASRTHNHTGRTPGATDHVRWSARDAAGNWATPLSRAVVLNAAPDTTAPGMTGSIAVSAKTHNSYTLTWQAATDAVGVTGYEYSLNGGTSYTDAGLVLTVSITGRTPEATDAVRVRAYDAAANKATPLSTSVTLDASPDAQAPVLTGPIQLVAVSATGHTTSWPAATGAVGGYEHSVNGGTTWTDVGNSVSRSVTGRTAGTVDPVRVRAYGTAAPKVYSATLSLDVALESGGTPPVQTEAYRIRMPAATYFDLFT